MLKAIVFMLGCLMATLWCCLIVSARAERYFCELEKDEDFYSDEVTNE